MIRGDSIDQNKVDETSKEIKQKYLMLRSVFDLVREEINKVEMKYINNILLKDLNNFEFSIRAINSFRNDEMYHLGDLVNKTQTMKKIYLRNGLKTLIAKVINHVRSEFVRDLGLRLLWTTSLIIISMWVLILMVI
jgi:hypothetical protein